MLLASVVLGGNALAQPPSGVVAGGMAVGWTLDGSTHAGVAGSIGYRLNRVFGLGVEVTFIPTFEGEPPFDGAFPPGLLEELNAILPPPVFSFTPEGGHATVFTTNARIEIPTLSRRVLPFVVGGGGIGAVREEYSYSFGFPDFTVFVPGSLVPRPFFPRTSSPFSSSQTSIALALTIGGGASVLFGERLSIDLDARYLSLVGNVDRHIGRFGTGVSYRW